MKRFGKIGCLGLLAVFALFVIVAMMTDTTEEPLSTGGTQTADTAPAEKEKAPEPKANEKLVDASAHAMEAAGLSVSLGDMKVTETTVEVGITVKNNSNQVVSFYPDQGQAVLGNTQLEANMFLTDGDVSGDIQPGVEKSGVLEFYSPEDKTIDVANVKEVRLAFGEAYSEDFMQTKDVTFTVPLP